MREHFHNVLREMVQTSRHTHVIEDDNDDEEYECKIEVALKPTKILTLYRSNSLHSSPYATNIVDL